jgi:GxxExxY protein
LADAGQRVPTDWNDIILPIVISAAETGVYPDFPATGEITRYSTSGRVEPLFFAIYLHSGRRIRTEVHGENSPFDPQKQISICYKGKTLKKEYIADFLCFDNIIVEMKSIKRITEIEEAQLINYLKATQLPLGLIINFGSPQLEWKHYISTKLNIIIRVY